MRARIKRLLMTSSILVLTAMAASTAATGEEWDRDMMMGPMMGPGMMNDRTFGFMCNPRHAGMAEWRIKRIEAEVKLTAAQMSTLENLRTASKSAADAITAACASEMPAKATDRFAVMEKRLEATLQAVKTVRPTFDAFYAGLDDAQKAKLDTLGPQRWGWGKWRWPWNRDE